MIITLLSDTGNRDAGMATAKGILMGYVPSADIVDITHHLPLHSQREAARVLYSTYNYFPKGTVHITTISAFVGTIPTMVIMKDEGHYFIVPDNGLLPHSFSRRALDNAYVYRQYKRRQQRFTIAGWLHDAGGLAKLIFNGDDIPNSPITMQRLKPLPVFQDVPGGFDCRILNIDRYGNVTLDVGKNEFIARTNGNSFKIFMPNGNNITFVSNHYNDVPYGSALCRFNKSNLLQIAINHGSAYRLLAPDTEDPQNETNKTIRIHL